MGGIRHPEYQPRYVRWMSFLISRFDIQIFWIFAQHWLELLVPVMVNPKSSLLFQISDEIRTESNSWTKTKIRILKNICFTRKMVLNQGLTANQQLTVGFEEVRTRSNFQNWNQNLNYYFQELDQKQTRWLPFICETRTRTGSVLYFFKELELPMVLRKRQEPPNTLTHTQHWFLPWGAK